MKHIFVRPLRLYDEEDKAGFIKAADAAHRIFPKDVFALPSTRVMVAEMEGRILMYQPHFASLNLGSLIPLIATPSEMASAQHQLFAAAFTRAHAEGFADIIAFSNDKGTRSFAKRHGFQASKDALIMGVR
jgi:hypothetical protein